MAVEFIDEDSVVSLKDIIEEEQELQDTANAVLGDSDDTNCTYPKVNAATQIYHTSLSLSLSLSLLYRVTFPDRLYMLVIRALVLIPHYQLVFV